MGVAGGAAFFGAFRFWGVVGSCGSDNDDDGSWPSTLTFLFRGLGAGAGGGSMGAAVSLGWAAARALNRADLRVAIFTIGVVDW